MRNWVRGRPSLAELHHPPPQFLSLQGTVRESASIPAEAERAPGIVTVASPLVPGDDEPFAALLGGVGESTLRAEDWRGGILELRPLFIPGDDELFLALPASIRKGASIRAEDRRVNIIEALAPLTRFP